MLRAAAIALVSVVGATPGFAEACNAPGAPDMTLEGHSATPDEFNALTQMLMAYDTATQNYRKCLDAIIDHPAEHPAEFSSALQAYNAIAATQSDIYAKYDDIQHKFQRAQTQRAATRAAEENAASIQHSQEALVTELTRNSQN